MPQDFITRPIAKTEGVKPSEPKTAQQVAFESKYELFLTNQSMALEIFQLPATTPKDELLYEIKERGIYYWSENIKIVDEMEKMDLPSDMAPRVQLLREYCGLRIKSYYFIYGVIERGEKLADHEEEANKFRKELDSLAANMK